MWERLSTSTPSAGQLLEHGEEQSQLAPVTEYNRAGGTDFESDSNLWQDRIGVRLHGGAGRHQLV